MSQATPIWINISEAPTENNQLVELTDAETILVSIATVLAGSLIGISCARLVPSSIVVEGLLALGVGLLLVAMFLFKRRKSKSLPEKGMTFAKLKEQKQRNSDADSTSTAGTDESAEISEPLTSSSQSSMFEASMFEGPPSLLETLAPLNDIPKKPLYSPKSNRSRRSLEESMPLRGSLTKKVGPLPPPADASLPIHVRVEQERLRLSFTDTDVEPESVKATATGLRFKDTRGRVIRYVLRPSKKATRATFLEVNVVDEDGNRSARKIGKITFDGATNDLIDKRDKLTIPASDVDQVMKSLKLLCKVAAVRLEATEAPPALRTVFSNLDFNGTTIRRVNSSGALSQASSYSGGALSQASNFSGGNLWS